MSGISTRQQLPVNTIADTDQFLISKDNGNGTFTSYKVSGSQMKLNFSGLTFFTQGQITTAPNATVPVNSLVASGSSSNIDVSIVPKGTGAFTLSIPDGTLTSGNKRGQYAVDLCLGDRGSSNQVASGNYSAIIGGRYNRAAGQSSFTAGESNQSNGNYSFSVGQSNTINGTFSVGMGGANSTGNDFNVAIGTSNICTNEYYAYAFGHGNAISSRGQAVGFSNSCSGLNSNSFGKSNTSSSAGATTIGDSNTASGSKSVSLGTSNISSGSYSYSMGYGNTAAGYNGVVALGWSNTISAGASYGAFAAGMQNGVSGVGFAIGVQNSVSNGCAIGSTNTASSGVALGTSNTVDAGGSTAIGKQASVFGIKGRVAYSAGQVSSLGDSQASKFILQRRTTDATATTLISDAVASPTPYLSNQVILSNNSAYGFTGTILAKQAGSTNAAYWKVEGLLVRGASAGATVLLSPTITLVSNVPGWGTPTLAADTSNGGLQIQVTGAAATNIQWTAVIETTEVIYA